MQSWEKNVRRVIPYVPGEQPEDPKMIKLNTNENPYPPSPKVEEALQRLDTDRLRRYPDPTAAELTKAIGRYCGFPENQVFVGVGSDDVLEMCIRDRMEEEKLLQEWIDRYGSIVFFGGAGVSTESGIPDFRSVDGCLLYTSRCV